MSESENTVPAKPLDTKDLLVRMIGEVEELRVAYQTLGRGENLPFTDLVVARLLKNPEFMTRLAAEMIRMAKAAKPPAPVEQPTLPAELKGVDESGNEVIMQATGPEYHTTAADHEFDDNDGYVKIVLGEVTQEVDGETKTVPGVIGGTIFPKEGFVRVLDPATFEDKLIIDVVNHQYQYKTTREVDPKTYENGRSFWYRLRIENSDPVTIEV